MRSRPWLQDAALALGAIVFGVIAIAFELGPTASMRTAAAFVLAVIAGMALLRRRSHAVVVLVIVAAARVIVTWDTGNSLALVPAAWIAFYTAARSGDRRMALVATGVVAIITMTVVAALESDPFVHELLGEAGLMLLPIALGDAARSRADRVRDLVDTEASTRVQAERLRIARDLHDVVAHGLSTIAVQSGIAAHLLDRDPGQAKESLEIINATGKSALEELRTMVGVLRSTDDAPLRPSPTDPNDLSAVLDGAARAGITMTTNISGAFPPHASESCVVALHRITQEALTNVARHAAGAHAHVDVRHETDNVALRVTNEPAQRAIATTGSTGVGIIGMVERAETLGGSLTARPTPNGDFEVAATLPYTRRKHMP